MTDGWGARLDFLVKLFLTFGEKRKVRQIAHDLLSYISPSSNNDNISLIVPSPSEQFGHNSVWSNSVFMPADLLFHAKTLQWAQHVYPCDCHACFAPLGLIGAYGEHILNIYTWPKDSFKWDLESKTFSSRETSEPDFINNTETMWQNSCRPGPNFHLLSSIVLLWEAELKPEMEEERQNWGWEGWRRG